MTTSPTTRDEQIAKLASVYNDREFANLADLNEALATAAQLCAEREAELGEALEETDIALFGARLRIKELETENRQSTSLQAENERLTKDRNHWKANHGDMVARNALLLQRPDLPVDRIPAHAELVRLQALAPAPVGEGRRHTYLTSEEIAADKTLIGTNDVLASLIGADEAVIARGEPILAGDEFSAVVGHKSAPLPAADAVLEGYNKDWRALYKAIGLPEDTTDAKIISVRVMEMRASAGLAVELAEYLFLTDCSDFDRYQWLKAECVRRCPAFFSLVGEDLLLNPARGGGHG